LGTPPEKFHWQWRDQGGAFHECDRTMTPLGFAKKFVSNVPYDTYVALIQDPRNEYNRAYTIEFGQTLIGGKSVLYLNVSSDDMKQISQKMLIDGKAVWFACNVGVEFASEQGLWDDDLYDYQSFYQVPDSRTGRGMSKADIIRYGGTMGTHAMLFTGVDSVPGTEKPRRWKVENSWGTEDGFNGYYCMNDNWFDRNVYEVIAHPDYLTQAMKDGLKKDPIILPAWDAMAPCRRNRRSRRH
jgi:bleomycin hydrolase